jgi:hypothetical protein
MVFSPAVLKRMRKAACGYTMPHAELVYFASRSHQNYSYRPPRLLQQSSKKAAQKDLVRHAAFAHPIYYFV